MMLEIAFSGEIQTSDSQLPHHTRFTVGWLYYFYGVLTDGIQILGLINAHGGLASIIKEPK